MEMLWNFMGVGRRHEMRRNVFGNAIEPELTKSPEPTDGATAFDAWLQAYRKRLEDVCRQAGSRHVPAVNANS